MFSGVNVRANINTVLITDHDFFTRVCSTCHSNQKLAGFGSSYDPWYVEGDIPNHHYVWCCKNTTCSMRWNRDINAAWNITYLVRLMALGEEWPELFRKQLDMPLIPYPSFLPPLRTDAASQLNINRYP